MSFFENEEKKDVRHEHSIWVEKYRPINLSEYIGSEVLKESLAQYIKSGDIPHILLHSYSPGTGKCLDYSENIDIEMELSDDEIIILKEFIQ